MAATDPIITLAQFLKFEAPDGDVRLCDGGFVDYDGERYESWHEVFGSIVSLEELQASFGDSAQDGLIELAPNPDAAVSDWWREDLAGCRIRMWQGDVDADNVTVTNATQLDDLLIDTVERAQDASGDTLSMSLMGRAEKLFLTNEGNVLSRRFHQTMFPGEEGLANCTDVRGFVAWGVLGQGKSAGGGGIFPGIIGGGLGILL